MSDHKDAPDLDNRLDRIPSFWIGTPDREIQVDATEPIYVGRMGDLVIGGQNPHMHRRLLSIAAEGTVWRLKNVGRYLQVHITDLNGVLLTTLAPGTATIVEWQDFLISVTVEGQTYVLDCNVEITDPEEQSLMSLHGESTVGIGPLTEEHRLILAAIGEDVLLSPSHDYSLMRKNKEVEERLGWSKKKFDHRLDAVCDLFGQYGIGNTRGQRNSTAANRRIKILQYAIESRLITRADLDLIEVESARNSE